MVPGADDDDVNNNDVCLTIPAFCFALLFWGIVLCCFHCHVHWLPPFVVWTGLSVDDLSLLLLYSCVALKTNCHPISNAGLDESGKVLRSLPLIDLSSLKRQDVQDYFDNTWTLFEVLFAGLNGEEAFYRYMCSRPIFKSLLFDACNSHAMRIILIIQATFTWIAPSTYLLLRAFVLSLC